MKSTVICSSCYRKLDTNHSGLRCESGHQLCPNMCTEAFMNTVLLEPLACLPVKCPFCKVPINQNIVERTLGPIQREKYQYHLLWISSVDTKIEGEVLCSCPFCDYFEFQMGKEEEVLFLSCKNSNCSKKSCVVCKLPINKDMEDFAKYHTSCRTLRRQKDEFERLLAAGNSMSCPECGLSGMKDIDCSRIRCPKCNTEWCYVCGRNEEDMCLRLGETITNHFEDWAVCENRCPYYLEDVSKINHSFPNDPHAALEVFHRNRSKMFLKKFVKDVGVEQFNDLWTHFQSVEHCGFTVEEIQNAPRHVFRPNPNVSFSLLETVVILIFKIVIGVGTLMRDIQTSQFSSVWFALEAGISIVKFWKLTFLLLFGLVKMYPVILRTLLPLLVGMFLADASLLIGLPILVGRFILNISLLLYCGIWVFWFAIRTLQSPW